jgi:hypothetical protein
MAEQDSKAVMAAMDEAAEKAAEELEKIAAEDPNGVAVVAQWMKKHYIKAGYKRLAKVLLLKA